MKSFESSKMSKSLPVILPLVGYLVKRFYFSGDFCKCTGILNDKTVLITGSNTGIGFQTGLSRSEVIFKEKFRRSCALMIYSIVVEAIGLAKRGANVVLACRNIPAAEQAAYEITQQTHNRNVHVEPLNLADMSSIRDFAKRFKLKFNRLDILINNAAVMNCQQTKTNDGFELQFGVNHLDAPAMDWDDLMLDKSYGANKAYRQSKLANVLFTHELAKKLKDTNIKAVSLHPGIVRTGLSRYEKDGLGAWAPILRTLLYPLLCILMKTPQQGAQTSIHCALADNIVNGAYYSDCKRKKPSQAGTDDDAAERLWKISVNLVGLAKDSN